MEVYSLAIATKQIYDSKLTLFSLKAIRDILEVQKESTFFSIVKRLIKSDVIKKVEKDKYMLSTYQDYFAIANFLYKPSYISFETALNHYGILSQFPYEMTSATPKKTLQKVIDDKAYSYTHIQKSLYWGYDIRTGFVIAQPEKALLDQLYIASKGIKGENLNEYDYTHINKSIFFNYLENFPKTRQFEAKIKELYEFLQP